MPPATLYPPAPADVPPDLTRPDAAYRGRVLAMVGGLFACQEGLAREWAESPAPTAPAPELAVEESADGGVWSEAS